MHHSTDFSMLNTAQFAPGTDDHEEIGLTIGDLGKRSFSIFRDTEEDSPGNQSMV